MEILKTLLNIRSLRAAARELTIEQLTEAHEKLSLVLQERQEEDAAARLATQERQEKIKQYLDDWFAKERETNASRFYDFKIDTTPGLVRGDIDGIKQ